VIRLFEGNFLKASAKLLGNRGFQINYLGDAQRAHRFRPLVSQEEFLRSRLQALADRLCDGALVPMVTTLLRSKKLSRSEREQLRKLIGDLWPPKESGTRNKE
jgi:Penicillinase repressor